MDLSAQSSYGEDRECPKSLDWKGCLVYYTVKYILTKCPLIALACKDILYYSSLNWIFGTEEEGTTLGLFLLYTQTLLCPLPPRPDPP